MAADILYTSATNLPHMHKIVSLDPETLILARIQNGLNQLEFGEGRFAEILSGTFKDLTRALDSFSIVLRHSTRVNMHAADCNRKRFVIPPPIELESR